MSNRRKPKKHEPPKRQKPTGPPVPPTAHDHGHSHGDDDVWIFTEPTLDGQGYMVTINAGKDKAATLTPDAALLYAQHLLWVASRAEYDALVGRQLYALIKDRPNKDEDPQVTVAYMVNELRQDRPPLDDSVTYPLTFSAFVNTHWEPSVQVEVEGQGTKGRWYLPEARQHALTVLEAVHIADLDAGYKRLLTGLIGVEEHIAGNIVDALSDLRGDPFSM